MQLPAGITSHFGRQILLVQKNAPQILFAGGIAAGIGSTVLACKATLQLETKLETSKAALDIIRDAKSRVEAGEEVTIDTGELYTLKDANRDAAIVYGKNIVELIKLYAPAIGLGVVSIALLTKSNHILSERNAGLAAAYAAVDKAFDKYRARVVEDQGEQKDLEYFHGTHEVEEINPETGRKKKVTHLGVPGDASMYSEFFDDRSSSFSKDAPGSNVVFLHAQQGYANDLLQTRGHVFLNEVLRSLGLPHTQAGSVVGWLKGHGDDFVSFNLESLQGTNPILLDFNVDGVIYDRIDEHKGQNGATFDD